MKKISIIIPVFNEEQSLNDLYTAVNSLMNDNTEYIWEVMMIDDGSTDHSLQIIKKIRETDKRISYIHLSRNFGKENAMLAGFDYVSGDCAIVMDADLQHPPYVIMDMIKYWEQGYEDVFAKRKSRGKESLIRKFSTKLYYKLLQMIAHDEVLVDVGDFRLLDRKCIDALKNIRETQRYTKGLYSWIGFKKHQIFFEQKERITGKSSFSYIKLINLAIDGITSYSIMPLRLSSIIGIFVSFIAFLYMCFVIIKTILIGDPVQGYPTLIIVILFLGGLQLVSIGIIGEYLGRIFYETKNRPVYIISEISNSTPAFAQ
jgi:glycosyltransferase involved in cell wall biosynthesis